MAKKKNGQEDDHPLTLETTAEAQAMMDLKLGNRERGLKSVGFVFSNVGSIPLKKRKQN